MNEGKTRQPLCLELSEYQREIITAAAAAGGETFDGWANKVLHLACIEWERDREQAAAIPPRTFTMEVAEPLATEIEEIMCALEEVLGHSGTGVAMPIKWNAVIPLHTQLTERIQKVANWSNQTLVEWAWNMLAIACLSAEEIMAAKIANEQKINQDAKRGLRP